MKNILWPTIGLIFLLACSGKKNEHEISIKEYYFPYKEFLQQKTYFYVNANDTSEKMNIIMQTRVQNGDTLFLSQINDSKNRLSENLVEKIGLNTSFLISYQLYNYDKENIQTIRNCKILDSIVFKWDKKLNESIIWRLNYRDFSTTNTNELSKTRVLMKLDTQNNKLLCKDQFHYSMMGTNKIYDWSMESYYQKGKGLVNFKVHLPDGVIKDYKLTEIKK